MIAARHSRKTVALWMVFCLMFMQFAVAGYVCPANGPSFDASTNTAARDTTTMAPMSPCSETMPALFMDLEQPNLCQAHCQADAQADLKRGVAMPPDLGAWGTATMGRVAADVRRHHQPAMQQAPDLWRATAPPLSIQHCCWRI